MPWWCLSFQSPVTSRVTTLYKVDRIPSLIAIDRGGCLITNDAVTRVSCDPKGLNFPWRPRTLVDLLPEYYLHSQGNGRSPTRELDDKYLLIYAGGQWCQLCQAFSNYLAKAYENLKRHRQDFEVSLFEFKLNSCKIRFCAHLPRFSDFRKFADLVPQFRS